MTSLKTVGLEHRANHMANILSGGEKQRVAIARALVCEPAFLFADEPTGALDKRTGQEIMALIQRLNLLGHTVVQVTHSPSDANYSKRILHLMDGLIVKDEIVERPTIGAISQETADRYSGELQARFWRIAQNTSVHSQENFEALRALLDKTPSQEGLVEAVKALVRWEGKEVEEILRSLARHEQWPVRAEVLRLSRTLPGNFWAEQCFEHLSDTNAWVRYLALQTIKQALPIALTAVWRESLVKCIQDDDERVRATAVAILGVLKEPGFFDPILAATDDRDGRVRANALESLASYFIDEEKAKSVMAQVETHLEDRHNRARANAVVIVSGSNMPLALETVAQMIVSENNLMRASAAWALGFLKEGAATQLLIDAIKIEKEELVVTQLVRALGQHTKHSLPLKEQLHHILDEREAA